MSSMLKKPGAGAFKPKAPIVRRRPAPSAAAHSPAQTQDADTELNATPPQELTPGPSQDVATSSATAESRPDQPTLPTVANGTTSKAAPAPGDKPPSTTAPTRASRSPEARRVAPVTRASPASKRNQTLGRSEPPTKPSGANQAGSTQPEESTEAVETPTELATSSDPPSVPAVAASKAIGPSKGVSTGQAKSTRSTASAKPRPATEATVPEASSPRNTRSLPTPSADSVTLSVDNGEGSSTGATATSTKARKPTARQPRKRKAAATVGENETETGAEVEGPPKKKRAPRKKKAGANGANGETQTENGEGVTSKRRSQRSRKAAQYAEDSATEQQNEGDADNGGSGSEQETEAQKTKKYRRKRSVTPEDAEEIEIDPMTMTLGQLTKDIKTGKRWEHHEKIKTTEQERKREYQRQRLIKKGLLKEGEELPNGDVSEAGTPAPDSSTPALAPSPPPPAPAPAPDAFGLNIRVVDGEIVVDETGLQFDRHAEADKQRGDIETREEHEFSRHTTQRTHARRPQQANFWTNEDTEKFYHGLRMFGTDFNMISLMFGGAKSRRQVKLKFNREERAHPVAINKCIIGEKEVAMDLDAVEGADELEDSKDIEDYLARLREEREAEARRLEEEIAAEARRKREELLGKRKGDAVGRDRDKARANNQHVEGESKIDERLNGAAAGPKDKGKQKEEANPAAKYGVGIDPDVIDETDLLPASTRGGRGGRGRGRGGRRGGKAAHVFASGFGV